MTEHPSPCWPRQQGWTLQRFLQSPRAVPERRPPALRGHGAVGRGGWWPAQPQLWRDVPGEYRDAAGLFGSRSRGFSAEVVHGSGGRRRGAKHFTPFMYKAWHNCREALALALGLPPTPRLGGLRTIGSFSFPGSLQGPSFLLVEVLLCQTFPTFVPTVPRHQECSAATATDPVHGSGASSFP